MEFINAVTISDLEGLLAHEAEGYTYENTDTTACQVGEFL